MLAKPPYITLMRLERQAIWAAAAAIAGTAVGIASIRQPTVMIGLLVLAAILLTTRRHPLSALVVAVATCSMYLGIDLTARIQVGSFPLSLLAVVPGIVLVAAWSVRDPQRRGLLHGLRGNVAIPLALLSAGAVLGTLLGIAHHADTYQLVRVDQVELSLLSGCLAGLVAGGVVQWQRSVVKAFTVAAALAAVQQTVSFAFLLAFGHSFWSLFPFGSNVLNVDQALGSGAIGGLRDNNIPTFIMLPGLALTIYRRSRKDVLLASLIIVATAASLSRSMWAAAAITIAGAMVASFKSGRVFRPARTARLAIVVVMVAALLGTFGSRVLGARLKQSGGASDISLSYRKADTAAALAAVLVSPASVVGGAGAGVVLSSPPTNITFQEHLRSPILEDGLLARWTNFGLMSVFGTILLLGFAALVAFRCLARRTRGDPDLMALGLAFPAILAVGPVAGTLLQLNVSLPFWILAGTILASWRVLGAKPARHTLPGNPLSAAVPTAVGRPPRAALARTAVLSASAVPALPFRGAQRTDWSPRASIGAPRSEFGGSPQGGGMQQDPATVPAAPKIPVAEVARATRNRRLRRGSVAAVGGRCVTVVVAVASVPVVLHYLGEARFGVWATITSLTALLTFADLGLSNGLVNAITDAESRGDRTSMRRDVSSVFVILTGVAIMLCVAFSVLEHYAVVDNIVAANGAVPADDVRAALAVYTVSFALSLPLGLAMRVNIAYQESATVHAWLAVGSALGFLGIVITTRLHGSLAAVVAGTVAGPLAAAALNSVILFGFRRRWLAPRWREATLKQATALLRIGFLWFVIQTSVAISYQSDALVLNHVLGPSAVTQYTVPMRLFYFMPGLVALALFPFWPAVRNAIASGDLLWTRKALKRMVLLSTAAVLAPTLVLLFFGPTLVHAWAGSQVHPSQQLLLALALWAMTASVVTPLAYLLAGLNAIRFQAAANAAMAVVNLALSVLGAEMIGISGVVFATVFANIVCIMVPAAFHVPRLLRRLEAGTLVAPPGPSAPMA